MRREYDAETITEAKCNLIPYRKGFIEIIPGIHKGCVNIETWQIDVDTNLNDANWLEGLNEMSVIANCELEMSLDEARNFAKAILAAIEMQ